MVRAGWPTAAQRLDFKVVSHMLFEYNLMFTPSANRKAIS